MNYLDFSLKNFLADEAGYDLVEFALAAALAGSVTIVALKDKWGDVAAFLQTILHG